MKTFSIQYAIFPLLLLLSGSSYWFLQVRSSALQAHKNERLHSYPKLQSSTEHASSLSILPTSTPVQEQSEPNKEDNKEFEEDRSLLPDVQLLKFILDKSKEGLPVLRLPRFL